MLLDCNIGENFSESLGLQGDRLSILKKSVLNIHWKDWCWSWNSNPLATCCEELTHWKRPWCWASLKAGGEGDDRGWDGWMASPTQWTRVWVNSGSWWWTGRPGVLQSMGSQRVRHNWATELNWATGSWKDRLKFAEVAWNRHQFLVIPGISLPALFRLTGLSRLLSVWCFISTCCCGYCPQ